MNRIKRRVQRRYKRRQIWTYHLNALRVRLLHAVGRGPRPFELALCLCFKNAARYLQEWIEFHRTVGVEHFFLYNNDSDDAFISVLQPYIQEGLVTLHDWPGVRQQVSAYDHCLRTYGPRTRWIGFIDDDEFLFPVQGDSILDVLGDFEAYAGVLVARSLFGSSGHIRRPPGGVLENYVQCTPQEQSNLGKSVVRPGRVICFRNPHGVWVRNGEAIVDENLVVCSEGHRSSSPRPTSKLLRINHYESKSEEDLLAKSDRGDAFKGGNQHYAEETRRGKRLKAANAERNTDIQRFLPALREAIQRRTAGANPGS